MSLQLVDSIGIRLIYDGVGPVSWRRGPGDFGLQDKAGVLHPGAPGSDGVVVFTLTLQVKPHGAGAPIFLGAFAHGPPAGRFLYLGWRNTEGSLAQRLKLPLGTITRDDVRQAQARQQSLVGTLRDHHPRATSTGANIGGSRPMSWALP